MLTGAVLLASEATRVARANRALALEAAAALESARLGASSEQQLELAAPPVGSAPPTSSTMSL
jgi:hypothetical protein